MHQKGEIMEAPKIPANEAKRLLALKNLNLLDTPIQENFERLTRITKAIFKVSIVAITLVDANRQWFKSVQGLDICETSRDVSFCGHVVYRGDLMVIPDTLADPRFADNPLVTASPFIRFYAGYPIKSPSGDTVGSLCIIDQVHQEFTPKELNALIDVAKLVEAEFAREQLQNTQAKLHQELMQAKHQAYVDGLTRLWNRSGIEALLRNQIAECQLQKKSFCVALIDIDNFKVINDTHGHCAGDAILRAVAKRLLSGYRETDSVGRWGGEEFLVIMDSSESCTSYETAEHARNAIASTPIMFEDIEVCITITTGLCPFKWEKPAELHQLVDIADKALYEGKHSGKNVVKIS
jgi:diguanylate cyclase (GGDEF)-like protein